MNKEQSTRMGNRINERIVCALSMVQSTICGSGKTWQQCCRNTQKANQMIDGLKIRKYYDSNLINVFFFLGDSRENKNRYQIYNQSYSIERNSAKSIRFFGIWTVKVNAPFFSFSPSLSLSTRKSTQNSSSLMSQSPMRQ